MYFISGTYINSAVSDGGAVYQLSNTCGNRQLYYNTIYKQLMITDSVPSNERYAGYNAVCEDEGVTDPSLCNNWAGITDITIIGDNGHCDQLCGHPTGSCEPQSFIDVDENKINHASKCSGRFTKVDWVDNMYVNEDESYYWVKIGENWKCTDQAPICDGTMFDVYNTLSETEMDDAVTCGMSIYVSSSVENKWFDCGIVIFRISC